MGLLHQIYLLLVLYYYSILSLQDLSCFSLHYQTQNLSLLKFGFLEIPSFLAMHTFWLSILASLLWTLVVAFFDCLPLIFCKANRSTVILFQKEKYLEALLLQQHLIFRPHLFYFEDYPPFQRRHLRLLIQAQVYVVNPQQLLCTLYWYHEQSHSLYGSTFNNHHSQSSVYHPCLHPMHQKNTPESSNRTSDFPCKAWHSIHKMLPLFYRWGWLSVS